jgi:DNA polymerase-3 subunit delta
MTSRNRPKQTVELIYVITGKETASVNLECEKLLDRLLQPQQRPTGLFRAEPSAVGASDVFDELRTMPFLTPCRVVIIKNADTFVSKNRQLLESYFDGPSPTGILILTVSSWPTKTRLAKKLPKVGRLITVTSPKPWELPSRLTQYARQAHDKNLSKAAAELLIEFTGDNLCQLYSEIDKLALFAYTEKAITTAHIESLIGRNRLFNAFAVIDACLAGDVTAAVTRLRNMFAEDKDAAYTTVGAFAFHLRRMFNAKVLLEKGIGSDQVAKMLGIWSSKEAFFSQLRKMPLHRIGAGLEQLAAIDYAVKTGGAKTEVAAEQLVLKLAGTSL